MSDGVLERGRQTQRVHGCLVAVGAMLIGLPVVCAQPYFVHEFERRQLTDVYYSEGANVGDINGDGHVDVVHGPFWFAGPEFKERHEIYPAKAQPRERYADHFFCWVHDFDRDGHSDVLVVGFPGTTAIVYENPGGGAGDWKKHVVLNGVSNEAPQFVQLVGDPHPELVCTHQGRYGYAAFDRDAPFAAWKFQPVSPNVNAPRFGHGLGIGDIDGDGRADLIAKNGWFRQPAERKAAENWSFHPYAFAGPGGAEMYAYDVDGDGDNDVITSLHAHAFGLAWFEQQRRDGKIDFVKHLIMGSQPAENPYGLVFTELHSVNLVDMDGDGLKDIVTGKTYWSHHTGSPLWDAGAVVYWFKLQRDGGRVHWVPQRADGEAGIGRQLTVADVNKDRLPDIVVGGMKGCHVLLQRRREVDFERWKAAQPKLRKPE